MNAANSDWSETDWRQLLAAYADGELAESDRSRVESWLELHPRLAVELSAQNEFSPRNAELWSSLHPPAPSAQTWSQVWNRVERGIDSAKPTVHPPRNHWWRRGLFAAAVMLVPATAAAIMIGIEVNRPGLMQPAVEPAPPNPFEEPFAVATNDDVEILSVRDADARFLVVGDIPFDEPLTLADPADVRLQAVHPDAEGNLPQVQMGGDAGAPMVFPATFRKK